MDGLPSFQPQDFMFLDFKLHHKATVPFVPLAQSTGYGTECGALKQGQELRAIAGVLHLLFIARHRSLLF